MKRRKFLEALMAVPVLTPTGILLNEHLFKPDNELNQVATSRLKISLNAYSFNEPLRNGTMGLNGLIEFCAVNGFDAVDLTAYYFPGYPVPPSDEFLFALKRRHFFWGSR